MEEENLDRGAQWFMHAFGDGSVAAPAPLPLVAHPLPIKSNPVMKRVDPLKAAGKSKAGSRNISTTTTVTKSTKTVSRTVYKTMLVPDEKQPEYLNRVIVKQKVSSASSSTKERLLCKFAQMQRPSRIGGPAKAKVERPDFMTGTEEEHLFEEYGKLPKRETTEQTEARLEARRQAAIAGMQKLDREAAERKRKGKKPQQSPTPPLMPPPAPRPKFVLPASLPPVGEFYAPDPACPHLVMRSSTAPTPAQQHASRPVKAKAKVPARAVERKADEDMWDFPAGLTWSPIKDESAPKTPAPAAAVSEIPYTPSRPAYDTPTVLAKLQGNNNNTGAPPPTSLNMLSEELLESALGSLCATLNPYGSMMDLS
jgi:hypothetical protein